MYNFAQGIVVEILFAGFEARKKIATESPVLRRGFAAAVKCAQKKLPENRQPFVVIELFVNGEFRN